MRVSEKDREDLHGRPSDFVSKKRGRRVRDEICGQLMGSPLSFPHFCAINFAGQWHAIDIWPRKEVDFKDMPVSFSVSRDGLNLMWEAAAAKIGFALKCRKELRPLDFSDRQLGRCNWSELSKAFESKLRSPAT